ncbi:hypothetical protein D9757_004448 [Collybiopsis confluens]|uniref:Uncharacterized protein n=1 Tax=Collybiopsis confluens TaxID=2823264 RepID=A0A8H5MDU0_9AGAR|nr:hypothetical protein D9757_004448 [Collybiopsis confluens]
MAHSYPTPASRVFSEVYTRYSSLSRDCYPFDDPIEREGSVTVTGAPDTGSLLHLTIVAPYVLNPDAARSQPPRSQSRDRASLFGSWKPLISVERVSVDDVYPRTIQDLSERSQFAVGPIDISQYAADVLHSLKHLSQPRSVMDDELPVCRFILSRCWAEVRARLDAARFLLQFRGSSLTRVLRGWSPRADDASTCLSSWESVRDVTLAHELQQERIPRDECHRETQCYFSLDTAPRWMRVLCKNLDSLQEAVERYARNDAPDTQLTTMAKRMKTIALLLRTRAIQNIFNARSLDLQLHLLRKRSHVSSTVTPTCSMIKIVEDERKDGESAGHHVLRYLHSTVSWYSAATVDLPHIMTRLSETSPILHIVKVPMLRPQYSLQMHSPFLLSKEELNKFLRQDIEFAYSQKELRDFNLALEDLFPRGASKGNTFEHFHGAGHALAVSLAIMNGDSSMTSSAPTSPHWVPTESVPRSSRSKHIPPEHLVKPASGGFATSSKQCCYCCSLLSEILSFPSPKRTDSDSDSSEELTSPFRDQYGIFVPWTPPPLGYGLGLETLARLERELKALLLGGVLSRLEHAFSATQEARAQYDQEIEDIHPPRSRSGHHRAQYIIPRPPYSLQSPNAPKVVAVIIITIIAGKSSNHSHITYSRFIS